MSVDNYEGWGGWWKVETDTLAFLLKGQMLREAERIGTLQTHSFDNKSAQPYEAPYLKRSVKSKRIDEPGRGGSKIREIWMEVNSL